MAQRVHIADPLYAYAVRLAAATRNHPQVRVGVSPRGVIALTRAACAYALIDGRGYVLPEDLKTLVEPVFAHRVLLSPDAQLRGVTAGRGAARRGRVGAGAAARPPTRQPRDRLRITARGYGLLAAGASLLLGVGFRFGYPELAAARRGRGGRGGCARSATRAGGRGWRSTGSPTPTGWPAASRPRMTLTVRNTGRLRAASLVAARPVRRPRRCRCRCCGCAPAGTPPSDYPVPTARRGVVPVGPLRVTRRDPLGLVVAGPRATARPPRSGCTRGSTCCRGARPAWPAASTAGSTGCRTARSPSTRCASTWSATSCAGCTGAPARKVGELMVREHLDTSLPRLVVLLDDRAPAHPTCATAPPSRSRRRARRPRRSSPPRSARTCRSRCSWSPAGGGAPAAVRSTCSPRPTLRRRRPARPLRSRLRQHRLGDTLVFLTGPGGRADLGLVSALRGPYPVGAGRRCSAPRRRRRRPPATA